VPGCGFIWRSAATGMIDCDPLAAARRAAWAAVVSGVLLTGPARADFPYPTCAATACADPADFGSYLFLAPGELPNDFPPGGSGTWKYEPETGLDITGAWQLTTGRPDVVGAILDSGLRWSQRDVSRAVWLNAGELPIPPGCTQQDCNGDGFFSVDDWPPDAHLDDNGNQNGFPDGQDLILLYSDGVDGDGNGLVDDIAGWDFYDGDNDPFDDVNYGHGTGEARDQVSEANDGGGLPGFAPSSRFVPLRVNDSFVALGSEFTQAVVYATDLGVDYISEALGTLSASAADQAAIDRAYRRGIPIIASAADEESFHHNLPASLDHTIWVNSIVNGDGTIVVEEDRYDLLNGCTNFGGHAWVAISSDSCSSEATGRTAGMVSLLIAHGKNLMDRGQLSPYPGSDRPFSAEEIRQLLRRSAGDIDQTGDLELTMFGLLANKLSAPELGIEYGSKNFPTAPGWDLYTGYGRPDAVALLDVTNQTIPPEADLSGSLRWFDTVDPERTPKLDVTGSAAAVRVPGKFRWRLEVGCGVDPREFRTLKKGKSKVPLAGATLARWKPAATAKKCKFDPGATIATPDAHTVTLRLRVEDKNGNIGEDRRTVAIHSDPALRFAPVLLHASAESSPVLADVDGDDVLDVVAAGSDGAVHALRGTTGTELPGFPAFTNLLPVPLSAGWVSGDLPPLHETVVGALAADDLDGDGSVEIVAAGTEGRLYVFEPDGSRRPGFPVTTNPAFSVPGDRNQLNDSDRGIYAAPTLADLDPAPGDGRLEILVAALDGYLYVWNSDGSPRGGFPVRVADPASVSFDPATGFTEPLPMVDAKERGRKLVSSPAVGDLDADGSPEIVLASNEEYGNEPDPFVPESPLTQFLFDLDMLGFGSGFDLDVKGRIYAVHADGNLHGGGPFRTGWPARVPLLASGLLPTVATGTPGAPALADLDGGATNELTVAIFGAIGPVLLLAPDGSSYLGPPTGAPFVLATDFPNGFPDVPATAGSFDAPFFGALGSGAFGDLDGDGLPEYVAPTGGFRKLIDVAAPASQEPGQHQVTAWDPRSGDLVPAFPRAMEDMQFLTSPAIADVDGDGHAEIVQGSGGYLLHAFGADGAEPSGWPKFTHGWLVSSPTVGDVAGDGQLEVVAASREGKLYVWDAPSPAVAGSVQWQRFGADRRNTQNWSAGLVSPGRSAARRGAGGAR
jgi:Subtilase family